MTEIGRRLVIEGVVQGVGYRFFTRRAASQLGVNGWCRNLPDGSVEVLARGPSEALERLETELRRGPAHARVIRVSATEVAAEVITNKGFDIK